jgi:hypothetical protein
VRSGFERTISISDLSFLMPNYRRMYGGSAYYFTVVTYHRIPILTGDGARKIRSWAGRKPKFIQAKTGRSGDLAEAVLGACDQQ